MEKEIEIILEGLGFEQDPEKKLLYKKSIDDNKVAYWDFRKNEKGRFYVSEIGGEFLDDNDAKQLEEYVVLRKKLSNEDEKPKAKAKPKAKPVEVIGSKKTTDVVLRGTEDEILTVVQQRNLDLIRKASKNKDKPGEGILYYDEKIGNFQLVEPSVELVDLITAQMGNISVEIIEQGTRKHIDIEEGDEYYTYYAIIKAKDNITGTEGLGSAEEIIDFNEMKREKNPRTFALTKAIRKAERNAKERLIPVPRKAMVELIKEIMKKK